MGFPWMGVQDLNHGVIVDGGTGDDVLKARHVALAAAPAGSSVVQNRQFLTDEAPRPNLIGKQGMDAVTQGNRLPKDAGRTLRRTHLPRDSRDRRLVQ